MSSALERQKELSEREYWDRRYFRYANPRERKLDETPADEGHDQEEEADQDYEWFRRFEDLKPYLQEQLPMPEGGCFIIHLGCGSSTLTADLFALGYTHQLSVDFSPVVIEEMQEKYKHFPELVWKTADVRHMEEIESGKYDVAIDKGTLDTMLYGSPWDPEEESKENIRNYVNEVARILADGGKWLYITFRQPHFLRPLLIREGIWDLIVHSLTGPSDSFEYFGYVMAKINKPQNSKT